MKAILESEVGYLAILVAGGFSLVLLELLFAVAGYIIKRK